MNNNCTSFILSQSIEEEELERVLEACEMVSDAGTCTVHTCNCCQLQCTHEWYNFRHWI